MGGKLKASRQNSIITINAEPSKKGIARCNP
jgi:hypothetical protein